MKKKIRLLFLAVTILAMILGAGFHSRRANAINFQQLSSRLVIKEGDLEVQVVDTDAAVESALNLAAIFDSYVLKQRIWDGEDRRYRYATMTFGMDADDFEGFMQALKTLGTVLNETASGQDVTDQRNDLNSRLSNLYITQTRMRSFLEQARDITETLTVHQELLQIEDEINDIQGQVNFLGDRAGSATVTLSLQPLIPTPTPTATSTPTPTATPTLIPTPETWRPGDTAQAAAVRLQNSAQGTADFIISRTILWGPCLLFLWFIIVIIRNATRFVRRRSSLHSPPPIEAAIIDEEE